MRISIDFGRGRGVAAWLLLPLLLCFTDLMGQGPPLQSGPFLRRFLEPPTISNIPFALAGDELDKVIFDAGRERYFGAGNRANGNNSFLACFARNGALIWKRSFAGGEADALATTPDGHHIVVSRSGSAIVVSKLDSIGNLLSNHFLPSAADSVRHLSATVTPFGDLFIAGSINDTTANQEEWLFMAFDDTLGLRFSKKLVNPVFDDDLRAMVPSSQGGVWVAGHTEIAPVSQRLSIAHIDTNGTISPIRYLANFAFCQARSLMENAAGNLVMAGFRLQGGFQGPSELMLLELSPNMVPIRGVLLDRPQGNPSLLHLNPAITQGSDGAYYVNYRDLLSGFPTQLVHKFDSNFTYQYTRQIDPSRFVLSQGIGSNGEIDEHIFFWGVAPDTVNTLLISGNRQVSMLAAADTSLTTCFLAPFPNFSPTPFLPLIDTTAFPEQPFLLNSFVPIPGSDSILTLQNPICSSCPYEVPDQVINCTALRGDTLIVPINLRDTADPGIRGWRTYLHYDTSLVEFLDTINAGPVLLGGQPSNTLQVFTSDFPNLGRATVQANYTPAAGPNAQLTGNGNVLEAFFKLKHPGVYPQVMYFYLTQVRESIGFSTQYKCSDGGSVTLLGTVPVPLKLVYNNDTAKPIRGDGIGGVYNETFVGEVDSNCTFNNNFANITEPDLNGNVLVSLPNFGNIGLSRIIQNALATSYIGIIEANDWLLTSQVATQIVPADTPTVFQIMAMDINRNGLVDGFDASSIGLRSVNGANSWPWVQDPNVVAPYPFVDWLFVSNEQVLTDPDYTTSPIFPLNNGTGFSGDRVPPHVSCLIPNFSSGACQVPDSMLVHAVLLGDVDSSWSSLPPDATEIRAGAAGTVTLDFERAESVGLCSWRVPVHLAADVDIQALDLNLWHFPGSFTLTGSELEAAASGQQLVWNDPQGDLSLVRAISPTGGLRQSGPALWIELEVPGELSADGFEGLSAKLNGEAASVEVLGTLDCAVSAAEAEAETAKPRVQVSPVPFSEWLSVDLGELPAQAVWIDLMDVYGRTVLRAEAVGAQVHRLQTGALGAGVYFLRVNREFAGKVVKK